MNAMKAARRQLIAWLVAAVLALTGCADVSNYSGVYIELPEDNGLNGERTHAYRITVFEYSNQVGGFVEFFEIDGIRNTPTNPYFEQAACVYFGHGGITNGEFAIDTSAFDSAFLARANLTDRRRLLTLEVLEDADTWSIEPDEVVLEQSSESSRRTCDSL